MNPVRSIAQWWHARRLRTAIDLVMREAVAKGVAQPAAAPAPPAAPAPQPHKTWDCTCSWCMALRAGKTPQALTLDVAAVNLFVQALFDIGTGKVFCHAHTVQMLGTGVAEVSWLAMTPETWRLLQPALESIHQRYRAAKGGQS